MATRVMKISGKVSDLFALEYVDHNQDKLLEYEGYVPSDLGIGSGDYLQLTIDVDSGKILNWKSFTTEGLEQAIEDTK